MGHEKSAFLCSKRPVWAGYRGMKEWPDKNTVADLRSQIAMLGYSRFGKDWNAYILMSFGPFCARLQLPPGLSVYHILHRSFNARKGLVFTLTQVHWPLKLFRYPPGGRRLLLRMTNHITPPTRSKTLWIPRAWSRTSIYVDLWTFFQRIHRCCACPQTKSARDDCFLKYNPSEAEGKCKQELANHIACMRGLGFKV